MGAHERCACLGVMRCATRLVFLEAARSLAVEPRAVIMGMVQRHSARSKPGGALVWNKGFGPQPSRPNPGVGRLQVFACNVADTGILTGPGAPAAHSVFSPVCLSAHTVLIQYMAAPNSTSLACPAQHSSRASRGCVTNRRFSRHCCPQFVHPRRRVPRDGSQQPAVTGRMHCTS